MANAIDAFELVALIGITGPFFATASLLALLDSAAIVGGLFGWSVCRVGG